MRLIVCGGLRIDFLISAQGEARLNQMGGNAVYAAVGARLWADSVYLLAKAGEQYPQEWLNRLSASGLRGEYVRRVAGKPDMRTFYAYVDEKTRVDHNPEAHFARLNLPLPEELTDYTHSLKETQSSDSPLLLRAADVPAGFADERPSAAHIAPMSLLTHRELVSAFHQQGVEQITVDPGEYVATPDTLPEIRAFCAEVDAFLPSELEVGLLLGKGSPYEAAEIFSDWGPAIVVIKRGPDGCLLYERDARRFTQIPAYRSRVVDVTGAGDSFGGGFAVGLQQTGDPLRAVLMGSVSASFTVEGFGALHSLEVPPEEAAGRLQALSEVVSFK